MSGKINFETGVPVTVTLRNIVGEAVDSRFGGFQYCFRTVDGGVFYLSDTGGALLMARLRSMELKPGEPITITKTSVSSIQTGRATIEWVPRRIEGAEAVTPTPAEASLLERQLQASLDEAQRKKAARATAAAGETAPPPAEPALSGLVAQTNALIDAYAAAIKHSARYEGLVKAEDVRSIFLSAVINNAKQGNYRAA